MPSIDKVVKWLAKSQGRDKLCKILECVCRYLAEHFKIKDQFNHFIFDNLAQSIKQARKLFRIFKSIDQYQGISYLIFYGQEQFSTILHIFSKTFYFFYWIFSNISLAAKVKLLAYNSQKYQLISLKIKFIGMIFSLIACFYELRFNKIGKANNAEKMIRTLGYLFNLIVVCNDSQILGLKWGQRLVAVCGVCSALISTYLLLNEQQRGDKGSKCNDNCQE